MSKSKSSEGTENLQSESHILEPIIESQKKFISFLESKVKRREVAEDIFQTSLLKALKNSKDLKDEQSLLPWFYQILKNAVTDYFRENKKIVEASDEIQQFMAELAKEDGMDTTSKEMLCACFKELLKTLNPAYADLLQQMDLNHGNLQEIANQQKATLSSMTVKLHRARKALKKNLEDTCGTCTKHGCLHCTCKT